MSARDALLSELDDLYLWCQQRTGDELLGVDLAHDTIVSALPRLESLRDPERIRPWLFRIAQRRLVDTQRRCRELPLFDVVAERQVAPEPTDNSELTRRVDRALKKLPRILRRPVRMHYLQGRPLREIAKSLRTSVNGVKARLYRARQLLRSQGGLL